MVTFQGAKQLNFRKISVVALSEIERLQRRVGKRIKELRAEGDMEQQELAALCNLEKTHLSRIEAGRQNLTLKMLQRIAKGLDLDVAELFVKPSTRS